MFGEVTIARLPAAVARRHRRRLAAILELLAVGAPLLLDELAAATSEDAVAELETERARAWADAACGRLSSAWQRLLQVAEDAGEALACAAEASYDALRFGAPPAPCAAKLRSLAARADSELFDAFAARASALATKDPQALVQTSERFAALGMDLSAAEAAADAARAFADEGSAPDGQGRTRTLRSWSSARSRSSRRLLSRSRSSRCA